MAVSFKLFNVNNDSTLFSQGQTAGQTLTLEITNAAAAGGIIRFEEPAGTPAGGGYHFALCFQNGFLDSGSKVDIKSLHEADNADWEFSSGKSGTDTDASDCFYIKRKNPVAKQWEVDETFRFQFTGIKVPAFINRNLRTKLNYRFMHEGSDTDRRPVEDFAEQLISVLDTFPFDFSNIGELNNITGNLRELEKKTQTVDTLKKEIKGLTDGLEFTDKFVELLADTAVSPLQARIINGWNFILPNTSTELTLEVSINPHFFTADKNGVIVKATNPETIIKLNPNDGTFTGEKDPTTGWGITQNGILLEIKPSAPTEISINKPIQFTFTYNSKPNSTVETAFLKLTCSGFTTETAPKKSLPAATPAAPATPRTTHFLDFDLMVPLQVGPLSVAEGKLGIGKIPGEALEVKGKIVSDTLDVNGHMVSASHSVKTLTVTNNEQKGDGANASEATLTVQGLLEADKILLGTIGDLEAKIASIDAKITSIDTRVINLEARVNNIETNNLILEQKIISQLAVGDRYLGGFVFSIGSGSVGIINNGDIGSAGSIEEAKMLCSNHSVRIGLYVVKGWTLPSSTDLEQMGTAFFFNNNPLPDEIGLSNISPGPYWALGGFSETFSFKPGDNTPPRIRPIKVMSFFPGFEIIIE